MEIRRRGLAYGPVEALPRIGVYRDRQMRIAYLILAHHQPKHVGAMIEQLDDVEARFFIHVDRKSNIAPFRRAITSDRAMLLDERLPINWGGWNMVRATLRLCAAHMWTERATTTNCFRIAATRSNPMGRSRQSLAPAISTT